MRRWVLGLLVAYAIGLQALIVLLLVKTDYIEQVEEQLDLTTPEFNRTYKQWSFALARSDARVRPGAVLFIGDSIMRDLDTSSMARHTVNLAIPGDTTVRALRRMQNYRSLLSARGVALGFGINDLMRGRSVPEALDNYRRIIALVPQATPLLLVAVLPVDERVRTDIKNADVRRLNEGLAAMCADRPGCRFIDPSRQLADGTGNLATTAHGGDGLHLSTDGHDIYWKALNAAVVGFLPPAALTPPER